ncbi:putative glucose dehydrogenase [Ixodes scapularis]
MTASQRQPAQALPQGMLNFCKSMVGRYLEQVSEADMHACLQTAISEVRLKRNSKLGLTKDPSHQASSTPRPNTGQTTTIPSRKPPKKKLDNADVAIEHHAPGDQDMEAASSEMTPSATTAAQNPSSMGGGSAGCLLANRLSANPLTTVLLLEAGGLEDASTEVPLLALLHFHGRFDWDYRTEPQNASCQSMKGKYSPWARGKVLGGSSVINFMMHVRGNKRDYNSWAEEYGAKGWSYDEVLPYFKSIESFHVKQYVHNGYHGSSGELPVDYPNTRTLLSKTFLEAGKELGYDYVDYNGPTQAGNCNFLYCSNCFSRVQGNVKDGVRYSASKTFIRPILSHRKNLHISLLTKVTKVLFKDKHAYGVLFKRGAEERTVRAKREVILSAGTIGSAQLLLLSGVGPADHLEQLNDHMFTGGVAATMKKGAELQLANMAIITDYVFGRRGPLAVPAGIEVLAFVNTPFVNASLDYPDVEIVLMSVSPSSDEGERYLIDTGLTREDSRCPGLRLWGSVWVQMLLRSSLEVYDAYYKPRRGEHGFQLAPIINRPKSKGHVRLRSADPDEAPVIDPRYLTHPDDIHVAVQGEWHRHPRPSRKRFVPGHLRARQVVHVALK